MNDTHPLRHSASPLPAGRLPSGVPAAVIAALVALGGAALLLDLPIRGFAVALAGLVLAVGALAALLRRHYPHRQFGGCNLVTLLRLALVAALVGGLAVGGVSGWPVVAVASVALALDGVDGWLARRSGLASDFGGRFDLEVDAALGLTLAILALLLPHLGAEVLLLGVMRYLFVAGGQVLPWMRAPLPPSQRRRAVCVIQLAALIGLHLPLADPSIAVLPARLAALALVWSFAVDTLWLWRHAR